MKYIPIGKIVNTHGLKGEVKIESWSDFDDIRYELGNTVYVEKGDEMLPMVVASYRVHKGYPLVSFEDYQDINLVEHLKTCVVYMSGKDRQPLPDGRYYVDELIGLSVYDEQHQFIGTVLRIEETNGAQNNIRVQKEDGSEVLIPNVPAFVKEINKNTKEIIIQVIPGLL